MVYPPGVLTFKYKLSSVQNVIQAAGLKKNTSSARKMCFSFGSAFAPGIKLSTMSPLRQKIYRYSLMTTIAFL